MPRTRRGFYIWCAAIFLFGNASNVSNTVERMVFHVL